MPTTPISVNLPSSEELSGRFTDTAGNVGTFAFQSLTHDLRRQVSPWDTQASWMSCQTC